MQADGAAASPARRASLDVEDRIVAGREVFRLQGATELEEAEKRYLPHGGAPHAR